MQEGNTIIIMLTTLKGQAQVFTVKTTSRGGNPRISFTPLMELLTWKRENYNALFEFNTINHVLTLYHSPIELHQC